MRTDRRTKYTKMVIREALLQLMKTTPFQKITIADICNAADISRPTFYFHYEDKFALLDEIGENMLISANLDSIVSLSIDDNDEIFGTILNLVRIIEENAEVYKICVLERGVNSRLPRQITEQLENTIIRYWQERDMFDVQPYKDYVVNFIQSAFNSVISCWLSRGEDRENAEEVAAMIKTFLLNGLLGLSKNRN